MRTKNKHASLSGKTKKTLYSYLMLSPQLIGFLVFTIYPIMWALTLAWFYYDGVPSATHFVGFDNFKTIFTVDTEYWRTVGNTFLYAFLKLPIEMPLALALALALNGKIKGKAFFRASFYLPNIISMAIIGVIFSNIFGYFGVINSYLAKLFPNMEAVDWFATKWSAFAVLVFAGVWQTFGINLLYFLAALQNIPLECYESAKLDGASSMTTFFKITLPLNCTDYTYACYQRNIADCRFGAYTHKRKPRRLN